MDEWSGVDSAGGLMTDSGDPVDGDFGGEDGGMMPVQYGGFGGIAGRMIPSVRPAAGGAAYAAGRAVGRGARWIMSSGKSISMTKLWQITQKFGPEIAAGLVGASISDLIAA